MEQMADGREKWAELVRQWNHTREVAFDLRSQVTHQVTQHLLSGGKAPSPRVLERVQLLEAEESLLRREMDNLAKAIYL